jgi:hypothetical protein
MNSEEEEETDDEIYKPTEIIKVHDKYEVKNRLFG